MHFKSLLFILLFTLPCFSQNKEAITIGSKRFTESYLVAEIFSQLLENEGYLIERRFGMAGTMITFNALTSGEIDVYPEYTGSIRETVLKGKSFNFKEMNQALEKFNIQMQSPLGFNNAYCIVMDKERAKDLGIHSVSDLKEYPELNGAFSAEFQARTDGWEYLSKVYDLRNKITSIEVPLTYQAVKNKRVDFAEAYTTEPLIKKLNLTILSDNKNFFPAYDAVALVRSDLSPKVRKHLERLSSTINHTTIVDLNAQIMDGLSIPATAHNFLVQKGFIKGQNLRSDSSGFSWSRLFERVKVHILLTGLAVLLATLLAVPIASFFAESKRASNIILGFTGILQTIPSIALLSFMIPFFGIGFKAALVGLFIYSLLPIFRNTHSAMNSIDPRLITSAKGIGLYPFEIFWSVKLPLAFPTILAGIRTATTLNIGTATLAAFIGAGGLGEPIVTGLALNNNAMVLQGAIPAAILALLVDLLFGLFEKTFSKAL